MRMLLKHLLTTLFVGLSLAVSAQKEVEQEIGLESATIINFLPPYREMSIYFEEQDGNRYGTITILDTTLFVRKSAFDKKRKAIKTGELMKPSDFVAGMKINLQVGYFQISDSTVARRICLDDKYYGQTTVTGIYERLDGDIAMIDGHPIMLEKGRSIEGREEWKNKRFSSFNDMQLGSEVQVSGERKPDGIVYATRGTMRPSILGKDDYLLRKAIDQELRVTKDLLTIANSWKFRFINNNRVQDYVNSVGRRMIPEYLRKLPVEHPDFIAFKFYLVDDASFNASSYPNGTIVIHKGLLTRLENEAQLAAILGHEIAHVTLKHHAQQFRSESHWDAVKAFGEVVAQGTGSEAPAVVTEITAKLSISNFSQKQETQADRTGLHYMVSAGYDPREAAAIWKRLAEQDKDKRQKAQQQSALNWVQKSFMSEEGTQKNTEKKTASLPKKQEALTAKRMPQPAFPMHPNADSRYKYVNFLISTAYARTDLNQVKTNADKYRAMAALVNVKPR